MIDDLIEGEKGKGKSNEQLTLMDLIKMVWVSLEHVQRIKK